MVEPGHPFERCQFDKFPGFPGCAAVNQFSLVQAVDNLGQALS